MLYKTIVLGLLEQNPALHERLRRDGMLLATLNLYSMELKKNHKTWEDRLNKEKPTSDANQAMELALAQLQDRLRSEFPVDEDEPMSLDGAMAYIRRHSPPA